MPADFTTSLTQVALPTSWLINIVTSDKSRELLPIPLISVNIMRSRPAKFFDWRSCGNSSVLPMKVMFRATEQGKKAICSGIAV